MQPSDFPDSLEFATTFPLSLRRPDRDARINEANVDRSSKQAAPHAG
jgi:hypothetical protein